MATCAGLMRARSTQPTARRRPFERVERQEVPLVRTMPGLGLGEDVHGAALRSFNLVGMQWRRTMSM
jgi:hypothetical protein